MIMRCNTNSGSDSQPRVPSGGPNGGQFTFGPRPKKADLGAVPVSGTISAISDLRDLISDKFGTPNLRSLRKVALESVHSAEPGIDAAMEVASSYPPKYSDKRVADLLIADNNFSPRVAILAAVARRL